MATRMIFKAAVLCALLSMAVPHILSKTIEPPGAKILRANAVKSDLWKHAIAMRADVELIKSDSDSLHLTYVELWDKKRHRIEWNGGGYNDTFIDDGIREWRQRNAKEKPIKVWQAEMGIENFASLSLSRPAASSRVFEIKMNRRKINGIQLNCFTPFSETEQNELCFDDSGTLLYAKEERLEFLFSDYANFLDVSYPQTITANFEEHPIARIHLFVEALPPPPAKVFEIPEDALPHEFHPQCEQAKNRGAITGGELVRKVLPVHPYPSTRLDTGGRALIKAIISEEGEVNSAWVISATDNKYAESALTAVRQWHYKPYQICGRPIEREVVIPVNFSNRFPPPTGPTYNPY